jgi:hypothetical protein
MGTIHRGRTADIIVWIMAIAATLAGTIGIIIKAIGE